MKNFYKINYKNKTDYVHEMFENLSQNYDFMNNIITFGMHKFIKEKALKNIPINSGMKILDVCTGTGDIPLILSQNYKNTPEITAIDFSEKMLEIAKQKTKKYNNINFLKADALNLPFEDNYFDIVFISFGLRNLSDTKKGIEELKRVAKKDGCVSSLDLGKSNGMLKHAVRFYFSYVIPVLGKIFNGSSEPYIYLPESGNKFASPQELISIFYDCGFKEVKNYNFAFGAIAQQVAKL